MRQSQTAVLERYTVLDGDFTTEPYEAGWAVEARCFVNTIESSDGARLHISTQISPDGLNWCDYDDGHFCSGPLTSWPVREFGQWLRLKGTVLDGGSTKVLIYLTLKS